MQKLKVGIIGLGVGEQHIAGFQSHMGAEVTSLCDFSDEKISYLKNKYPGMKLTKLADEVLDDPEIKIVSIASFDNHHYEQVMRALKSGKHVFVEKPICMNAEQLKDIRAELKKRPDLKLSSNLILRKYPRFAALKKSLEQGELGQLFSVEGDYNYGRLQKIHAGWRGEMPGYSVMLGGGVHLVDLLLWLTGEKVVEVAAFGNRICSEGSHFKQNDMEMAILRFESGLVGKISANFGCVYPHFHELRLYGTRATFVNGLKNAALYTSRNLEEQPKIIADPYPGANKGDLIHNFVDSIVNNVDSEVSSEEIFSTMSVCFAIEEAIHTSKNIRVNYI
jgi:predicted dehydrogenase